MRCNDVVTPPPFSVWESGLRHNDFFPAMLQIEVLAVEIYSNYNILLKSDRVFRLTSSYNIIIIIDIT